MADTNNKEKIDKNYKKEPVNRTTKKIEQIREAQTTKRTPEDEKRALEHISVIMQRLNSGDVSTNI